MKVTIFDTHRFEKPVFEEANLGFGFKLHFLEARLTPDTAALAEGAQVVCSFVNDQVNARTLVKLKEQGVDLIALRSAGFNHVDLTEASRLGIKVVRVPAYSPYAVAEHAAALILALNRKIHRAHARVRENNFSLEGLVGFDLHGKTIGLVGTGKIGSVVVKIMNGFGCKVLAYDIVQDPTLVQKYNVQYVEMSELLQQSDIVSLHLPLTPQTHHMIDETTIRQMKNGVMLINTSRGGLIDTRALIQALKSGKIGSTGLDVYEEEENIFFQDLSDRVLQDDLLARLTTFPNVLITSHQGFLTREALQNIALTTLENVRSFELGFPLINQVLPAGRDKLS